MAAGRLGGNSEGKPVPHPHVHILGRDQQMRIISDYRRGGGGGGGVLASLFDDALLLNKWKQGAMTNLKGS